MIFKSFLILVLCTILHQSYSAVIPNADDDWWTHGVFYQIYPRSYKDSDNDGDGDLQGIKTKLYHLQDAGITGVWLSPIFQSPMRDQGYDISDYYAINPMFGTIQDLKEVIDEAHRLGLKIIMDFVPNHTSDEHEWFRKSEDKVPGYEDYYVWVDGTPDKPPNNWNSIFKNSTWTWSTKRNQWYLHQFLPQQPDLNFRCEAVHEEMRKVLYYYMDLGIDGFRVDAVPFLVEDEQLRDEPRSYNPDAAPIDREYLIHIYTENIRETFELTYEFRSILDDYTRENGGETRVLMTEAYCDLNKTMWYYGNPDGSQLGAHFTFNFFFVAGFHQNYSNAHTIQSIIYQWLNTIPEQFVSNWVLGNHDQRRAATRYGAGNIDAFNMMMTLLPGIGVTYNGEEIGQEDGEVKYEEGQDPSARDPKTFDKLSRDFERTPFQWDDTVNAGFNDGAKPWLPVSKKYHQTNLEAQVRSKELSHYQIYKSLLKLRQNEIAKAGTTDVWALSDDAVVIRRSLEDQHIAVAFKLGWHNNTQPENFLVPGIRCNEATVLLTNVGSKYKIGEVINPQSFVLKPNEALVLEITC